MRLRGLTAAVAGAGAAATAHALDVTGRLPFVHESVTVRMAMSPVQVVLWLLCAAGFSALAARTRPWLVGAPGALAVSAAPELIGRHDPGAIVEPGALLGALLQLLLVVAIVAVAVMLERRLVLLLITPLAVPARRRRPWAQPWSRSAVVSGSRT